MCTTIMVIQNVVVDLEFNSGINRINITLTFEKFKFLTLFCAYIIKPNCFDLNPFFVELKFELH